MSIRPIIGGARALTLISRSYGTGQAEVYKNGDPGPNAAKFRKSQRKALRQGNTRAVGSLDILDGLMDPQALEKIERRPQRPPREYSGRMSMRDPGSARSRFESPGKTAPDAYGTSLRLRKAIQPRSGAMTSADIDRAIQLVTEAPRSTVSTPVWNMLLGMIGREGRLELMWKTFNDMKKRGFKPSSRTFITLLNAYAGLRHSGDTTERRGPRVAEPKTASRVAVLHDQARTYLLAQEAELERQENQNDPDELGLGTQARVDVDHDALDSEIDINVGPTNAYLKFLSRYGMIKEMEKVFTAMSASGPLSPDSITYSTMFSALYDSVTKRSDNSTPPTGLTATGLWAQACRQFGSATSREKREIDEDLVIIAVKCLSRGDQASQRQVMDIVESIWPLPRPADTRSAPHIRLNRPSASLPQLPLSIRAATTIMAVCPKPTDRSHYAHLFLDKPELRSSIDTPFLITAIRAFSETGDVHAVVDILDSYQPRQPNQWPINVWHDALTAARWSVSEEQGMKNQPDFDAALSIFRRMAHLPPGVEDGEATGIYEIKSPNGKPVDNLGTKWARPSPLPADAKAMSLLFKTALSRGWRDVNRALMVFFHIDGTQLLEPAQSANRAERAEGRQWEQDLRKDLERSCEKLLEKSLPENEKTRIEALWHKVKSLPEASEVSSDESRGRFRRDTRPSPTSPATFDASSDEPRARYLRAPRPSPNLPQKPDAYRQEFRPRSPRDERSTSAPRSRRAGFGL